MILNYFNLAWIMLVAGFCSFGDGIGGIAFLRLIIMDNYKWLVDNPSEFEQIFAHTTAFSQIGGYAQSVIFSGYIGSRIGVFGSILAVICYCLPAVLVIMLLIKLGMKFYKNQVFIYTIKYMNLLYLSLVCGIVFNLLLYVFGTEPMFYTAVAGLACVARLVYRVNPAIIIACGGICGLILRA